DAGLDQVVAVEAETDDLLAGEVLGESLAERICVLVDDRDAVAAALETQGELTPYSAASHYDDVHALSLRPGPEQAIGRFPPIRIADAAAVEPRPSSGSVNLRLRMASCVGSVMRDIGRNRPRGIRQARPGRSTAGDHGDG